MIAAAAAACPAAPTTAEVVQNTILGLGGMGLFAFVMYGLYRYLV